MRVARIGKRVLPSIYRLDWLKTRGTHTDALEVSENHCSAQNFDTSAAPGNWKRAKLALCPTFYWRISNIEPLSATLKNGRS
jgi:hypothetical protein